MKQKIKKEEAYFKAHDQHRLYYEVHEVPSPKAVLIFVHGLNEHVGRYQNPIKYFGSRGYTLYLFDQRGHGKSDGLRSFVDSFDQYLKDLHEFCLMVRVREKGKKLFMIGHSMGGQVLLNYLGHYNPPLAGFVASSANIETGVKISRLKKAAAILASNFLPRFSLANDIDPKWISRDKDVVKAYKADPLVSPKITLKLAAEILLNQESLYALATKIRIPGLILHGSDDHICKPEGSRKFFRKLASTSKDLKIYDGFYHELFNEIGKEKVFQDIEEWLERH